jgi:hypothetical protein
VSYIICKSADKSGTIRATQTKIPTSCGSVFRGGSQAAELRMPRIDEQIVSLAQKRTGVHGKSADSEKCSETA